MMVYKIKNLLNKFIKKSLVGEFSIAKQINCGMIIGRKYWQPTSCFLLRKLYENLMTPSHTRKSNAIKKIDAITYALSMLLPCKRVLIIKFTFSLIQARICGRFV